MQLDQHATGNNMTIPSEKGLRKTIDPGSVRVQDEYGAGYMGMLEVFHQLHCLVSKAFYFDIAVKSFTHLITCRTFCAKL